MKRINIATTEPQAYKAMFGLEEYLQSSKISKRMLKLIKVRASQINGCAFCIDMHTREALEHGETSQRLFLLDAWRETQLFTEQEKAVLAMTEEVTLISNRGLSASAYTELEKHFDEHAIAQLIMAVVVINGWNRIAISTHMQVPEQLAHEIAS